jgi:hypothetical protein
MEQLDWIEELEKKKKRWYYRQFLQRKAQRNIQRVDFVCDLCRRDIVVEVEQSRGARDELKCVCGKIYYIGAEIINKWVGPYDNRRHTTRSI